VPKCELIAHKDFQVDDALLQSFHGWSLKMPPYWERLCFPV